MAIFYYSGFSENHQSSNFGDDVNPMLMNRLFDPSLINSQNVCIMGVGTLINNENVGSISRFPKKIVFSSGIGYGDVDPKLDSSWECVCVRGPKTAQLLGLGPDKAICDGAVLLSDYFAVVPENKRDKAVMFIPHIKTHWAAGKVLKKVAEQVGMIYLPPDLPPEEFIAIVAKARLVVTEAMHGAILADTMRVPWIPVSLHEHNRFKWEDWFSSIGLEYRNTQLPRSIWNAPEDRVKRLLKYPFQRIKVQRLSQRLSNVLTEDPALLSDEKTLDELKRQLREKIGYINRTYGDVRAE